MTVLRQHPALCSLGLKHDGVSTDIWDSMFWWSLLTKYKCCQRAGFHFMLVQLQNKILPLENLTYHWINTNTWALLTFESFELLAIFSPIRVVPPQSSHPSSPRDGTSSRHLPAHPLRPEHSLSKLWSPTGKRCSPGQDVSLHSLACGGKCSLGHWHPLFLPCSSRGTIHVQALEVSLALMFNYSRCPIHDRDRGSEDTKAAEAEGHYSHPSRQHLCFLLSHLSYFVRLNSMTPHWVAGEFPRDINWCLKWLQRAFSPSHINSRNEEIGLDFILTSAPQVSAHFKTPS